MPDGGVIYARGFAAGLRPDPETTVSAWAEQHRFLAKEASVKPGRWRNDEVPYLTEIMECLSPSHPSESVTVQKGAQSGGSETANNFLGFIADQAPGPALVVHPTVDAAKAWVREKLEPTIEATPRMRARIVDQKSRDNKGSTTLFKRFPGGFMVITGANSTAGLRQKSIRYLIKDDWDEWPLDVAGQGDPDKMADARQMSYHESGLAKALQVSTPTIKGRSRVERAYLAGDQREFEVPCSECGGFQTLNFKNLKFSATAPHNAHYACGHCGILIPHWRKREMLARGKWVARMPGVGRQPSFKINSLYSPLTTWDKMAKAFVDAKDDPSLLKTFVNLWLGETWDEKGEAPPATELHERAENYELGRIPAGGLIVTCAVDVQKTGVFYEIVAWGVGKESWSIDYGFIQGDPAEDPATGAVWAQLTALYEREFATAFGTYRRIDMMAIDSGYCTNQVYAWVRSKTFAMAVKGVDGWERAVFAGPSKVDVTYNGKKRRRGMLIWPVYVWNLKSELYANLRKGPPQAGDERFPAGYCHFSTAHDLTFFQQLTAEYLKEHQVRGRLRHEWHAAGENHYHDCRIYNMAAFHRAAKRFKVAENDPQAWLRLQALRAPVPVEETGALLADLTEERQADDRPPVPRPAVRRPFRRSGFVQGWRN
jgi:phage terminase large subunit GpA-like protein